MNLHLPPNLHLAKLPPAAELTLFLIGEEMKNRRLCNRLEAAGFDMPYTADLSMLILTLCGFDPRPDELYECYNEALDEACASAEPSDAEAWREAVMELYVKVKSFKC